MKPIQSGLTKAFNGDSIELKGRTASLLRLQRFASWYDADSDSFPYVEKIKPIRALRVHGASKRLLKRRPVAMLTFKTCSAKMKRMRRQLDIPKQTIWSLKENWSRL